MFTHVYKILSEANEYAYSDDVEMTFKTLRRLSLDEFAELHLGVPNEFPMLKKLLPIMPPDKIQNNWTGTCGMALNKQSCAFVKSIECGFQKHLKKSLLDIKMLDYGCGWGRIARLMIKYANPADIYGVDPWDESIKWCEECNVHGNFSLCDYVPKSLPFDDLQFDLVFAFSVFTHLSKKTADSALKTIRSRINNDGLLVLTIRPIEYWQIHRNFPKGYSPKVTAEEHFKNGFAFIPHNRAPIDGDITYGDASMTFDYIINNWKDWTLVGYDLNYIDNYQIILFLSPN